MIAILFWLSVGLILYSYVGYPALLFVLSRFRTKQPACKDATPALTLLIAAYNEEESIAAKLENSLALCYPKDKLQILVAVDGSTDGTASIVQSYAARGVELRYSPMRLGKIAAINRAISRAEGEVVVFSDANNMFDADALQQLVACFGDSSVGAVTGSKIITRNGSQLGESEGLYWRYESKIKEWESRLGCCIATCGEIFAVRRGLLEPAPEHIINDDAYIALRLMRRGYRILYAPAAHSRECVSADAKEEKKRRARIFAGRYQILALTGKLLPFSRPLVAWQVLSHKYSRALLPLAMITALVSSILSVLMPHPISGGFATMQPPINWILLGAQLAFYGIAFAGSFLERSALRGAVRLLYIPAFLVNSNFAGLVGLARFFTRSQTVLWQRAKRAASSNLSTSA